MNNKDTLFIYLFISFDGQGQFCPLTRAEWRDLSNHTRMCTIQSRTPEKEAKNHVTLTWKSQWKSCSIPHLPFLSPNPKILKAFLSQQRFTRVGSACQLLCNIMDWKSTPLSRLIGSWYLLMKNGISLTYMYPLRFL